MNERLLTAIAVGATVTVAGLVASALTLLMLEKKEQNMTTPSGQPFQPIDPTQPSQPTAPAASVAPETPETRPADRTYAVGAQQLGQVVHDLLTTGATFTLDGEDPNTGTVTFHDYNGARFTLTMSPSADGTQTRLSAEGDQGGKRAAEFYAALDPRVPAPVPTAPSSPADQPAPVGSRAASGSHAARPGQGRHGAASATAPDAPNKQKLSWLTVIAVIVAAFFLIGSFNGITTWSTLLTLTVISAALSALAVYITRKDPKGKGRMLAWAAAGLTAVALVVGCVNVVRAGVQKKADEQAFQESMKVTCGDYTWPTSDLVAQLPQPQSATGEIRAESSSSFNIAVCDTDASGYDAYVKSLQEKGFTVDYNKTDTAFNGKNEAGYSVHVDINEYNDNVMDIAIYPPSTDTADGTGDAGSTGSSGSDSASGTDSGDTSSDSGAQSDQTQSTPSDGSSSGTSESDFKAAMDSYEKTMDAYVDFMTKYNEQGHPVSMLADYTKLMVQYNDALKKFDAVDESTLTPEEQQYYIEVQTRVNQKLATLQ